MADATVEFRDRLDNLLRQLAAVFPQWKAWHAAYAHLIVHYFKSTDVLSQFLR